MKLVKTDRAIEYLLEMLGRGGKGARRFGPIYYFVSSEDQMIEALHPAHDHGTARIFGDAKPDDLGRSLDVTMAVQWNEGREGSFALTRIRKASLKECRGRVTTFSTEMVKITSAFVLPSGEFKYPIDDNYYALRHGKWKPCSAELVRESGRSTTYASNIDDSPMRIPLAIGYQFALEFDWTVSLGEPEGLKLGFETTPEGARKLFKDRDVPEGKNRRLALKHWVQEHSRKRSKDDEIAAIKVMQHLRGGYRFNWRGYECSITPPESDLRIWAKKYGKDWRSLKVQ